MIEQQREMRREEPCGFGIFHDGTLLIAFPRPEQAQEVLKECTRDGHPTGSLTMQPIFQSPPPDTARPIELEAKLESARRALDAATRQRDELHEALLALHKEL